MSAPYALVIGPFSISLRALSRIREMSWTKSLAMPSPLPKFTGISRHIGGVVPERFQRHDLESGLVGGGEHDGAGSAVQMSLEPAYGDDAPSVARVQPGEVPFGVRGDEIVADVELVLEELARHDGADRVAADVLRSAGAAAVAVEAGDRV